MNSEFNVDKIHAVFREPMAVICEAEQTLS